MKYLFSGTVLSLLAAWTVAKCVPGKVPQVTLDTSNNLYWTGALNPDHCYLTEYVIDILDQEDGVQLQYSTNALTFDVNFLDACKSYVFEVHAMTNESVLGAADQYNGTTSPTAAISLNVTSIKVTSIDDEIDLTWTVTPSSSNCVSYYRVVYWDEANDPIDVYVDNTTFNIKGEIPCMNYSFQVNAIVTNPDIQGPPSEVHTMGYKEVQSVPQISSITTTATSVTMVWQLESYDKNRCNVTGLYVSTLEGQKKVKTTVYPVSDNVSRPNVNFTIDGLSPDTVYTSYVSVLNEAGSSKNVTVNFQTDDSVILS